MQVARARPPPSGTSSSTPRPTTRGSWSRRSTRRAEAGPPPSSSTPAPSPTPPGRCTTPWPPSTVRWSSCTCRTRPPGSRSATPRCMAPVSDGSIAGFGGVGYRLAVEAVDHLLRDGSEPVNGGGRMAPGALVAPRGALGRLGRLRELLARTGPGDERAVDGLVVTTPANVRWLSGFSGSAGLLLVTGGPGLAGHRRALPDPGGRAAGRRPVSTPRSRWPSASLQAQREAVVGAAGGLATSGSRPTT